MIEKNERINTARGATAIVPNKIFLKLVLETTGSFNFRRSYQSWDRYESYYPVVSKYLAFQDVDSEQLLIAVLLASIAQPFMPLACKFQYRLELRN